MMVYACSRRKGSLSSCLATRGVDRVCGLAVDNVNNCVIMSMF